MPTRTSSIVVLAALLSAVVAADDQVDLDRRISLELSGAPAADVFNSFSALVSAEPSIDPDLEGEVTIQLTNVSARTTMNAVCEMLSCKWWIDDGPPRRLVVKAQDDTGHEARETGSLDTTVSLSLSDAPVEEVLRSFAEIGRWELSLEKTTVSVELDAAPVRHALDEVCAQAACTWSLDQSGDQGILRIDWID